MREWLVNTYILMYLTHNEDKPVIAERFIRTLMAKIYNKVIANLILVILIN